MLELWYQALRAHVGIRILSDDPKKLQQKLYAARREALDPELAGLALILPPGLTNQLWIAHKSINLVEEELTDAEGQ